MNRDLIMAAYYERLAQKLEEDRKERETCQRCGGTGLVTLYGVPNGIGFEMDADDQPCPECKS